MNLFYFGPVSSRGCRKHTSKQSFALKFDFDVLNLLYFGPGSALNLLYFGPGSALNLLYFGPVSSRDCRKHLNSDLLITTPVFRINANTTSFVSI